MADFFVNEGKKFIIYKCWGLEWSITEKLWRQQTSFSAVKVQYLIVLSEKITLQAL